MNYAKTNGSWVRKSVPFIYDGASSTPEFILVTFTTNKIPGGGSAGDEIKLDDVSLVYNNTSVDQEFSNRKWVSYTIEGLVFSKSFPLDEELNIYSTAGALLKSGTPERLQGLRLKNGIYLISGKSQSFKVIAH